MSAEMPPEQINPYASPREVSAEAEDTLRRQTPFGLTEPIHAAGTLTPEELRSEVRRSFGLGSKQSWGWILLLLGLSVLLAWQTTKPWILILAAVCVSFGALIWRSYRGRVQQGIADWCRERKEFWFSETSVTIGATTFQKTLPWEAFARCTVSDTLLSLHSIWSDALCVPRSFVALASDWQRLTALVRHKLPETPTAQPSESEKPLPAWAESDGPLRGQGHLGYEDALALLHRSRERARFWQEAVLALGPLARAAARGRGDNRPPHGGLDCLPGGGRALWLAAVPGSAAIAPQTGPRSTGPVRPALGHGLRRRSDATRRVPRC